MRTPLYEEHIKTGGKMVDFHGWELPVQYGGIIQEHEAVRNAAGLFDVSHMGELLVEGRDAGEFIQGMITNDISNTKDGQAVYSPMCYPDGGTVDDLIVYRRDAGHYFIVVNASNTEKDYRWLLDNRKGQTVIKNVSDQYAQLALQGPESQAILRELTDFSLEDLAFFRFSDEVEVGGVKVLLSRSGYTGEDGFELYAPASDAVRLWRRLMEAGREYGLVPVGLGARDTLRFEAALPLYGQELSEDISPLEAGLGRFVKLDKKDFTGMEPLAGQQKAGVPRRLVGFEMVERGVPRSWYEVCFNGKSIGYVTSGNYSPTLKKNLGMALVETSYAVLDGALDIIIRDRAIKARIIKLPFYNKKYHKREV